MTKTRYLSPTRMAIPAFLATATIAASNEGRRVADSQWRTVLHFRRTNSIGQAELHTELSTLAESCQESGWDGYDAFPINPKSVEIADRLIDSLPRGLKRSTFSMGAEPDGQVTFEWHKSPAWTLSVSISPYAEAHYSALLGPDRRYGTESLGFPVRLPLSLRELIHRIENA